MVITTYIVLSHRFYRLLAIFEWFNLHQLVGKMESKIGQIRVCELPPLFIYF